MLSVKSQFVCHNLQRSRISCSINVASLLKVCDSVGNNCIQGKTMVSEDTQAHRLQKSPSEVYNLVRPEAEMAQTVNKSRV